MRSDWGLSKGTAPDRSIEMTQRSPTLKEELLAGTSYSRLSEMIDRLPGDSPHEQSSRTRVASGLLSRRRSKDMKDQVDADIRRHKQRMEAKKSD